jgi:hypothetical protein
VELKEDSLLSERVLRLLEQLHGNVMGVYRHVEVGEEGLEVDAVVLTKRSRYRVIGVELKASDLLKAVRQAAARRPFFHYFYIVSGQHHNVHLALGFYIDTLHRHGVLQYLTDHGIGWIMVDRDKTPWLIYPSKYVKTEKTLKPDTLFRGVSMGEKKTKRKLRNINIRNIGKIAAEFIREDRESR